MGFLLIMSGPQGPSGFWSHVRCRANWSSRRRKVRVHRAANRLSMARRFVCVW